MNPKALNRGGAEAAEKNILSTRKLGVLCVSVVQLGLLLPKSVQHLEWIRVCESEFRET